MECVHPITLKSGDVVPCGKCYACLANQRQEWVFRLQQEYLSCNFSIFVTFTYDEEHIPADYCVNKRDIQLFHKRLRKHFPPRDLRFYVVSEYGDHTFRPHYHGLYFFKGNYDKKEIYDIFEKSWNMGFLSFGDVEEGSIVYCTKYCLKHKTTPDGRTPTFRLVSKMSGGLGVNYLEKMFSYHLSQNQFSYVSHNGKNCRMPRYYRLQLGHQREDRFAKFDELYTRKLDDFRKRYSDYLQLHPELLREQERQTAFTMAERDRRDRREELVIKHCKKQKM